MLNDMLGSKKTLFIKIDTSTFSNIYQASRNTIFWNPKEAINLNGKKVSPALILGHELNHAYSPTLGNILEWIPAGKYSNAEEFRVIKFWENPTALILGEGIRNAHDGESYSVNCVWCR